MPTMAFSRAEVTSNLRRSEALLNQAGRLGAELIVMPELFATGYSFLSPEQAASVAEGREGPTFRFMAAAAVELEAYLAWGFLEADGSSLYNSSAMVGPDGKLVLASRKMNLWGNDFLWASPGRFPPPVVQTEIGMMSSVVCRDVRNHIPSNLPRNASNKLFETQPDVVALHAAWGKGGFPATQWMDMAADVGCVLAVANRWGLEKNGDFEQDFGQGGSIIIDRDWTTRTDGLAWGKDCVVCARVETRQNSSQENES